MEGAVAATLHGVTRSGLHSHLVTGLTAVGASGACAAAALAVVARQPEAVPVIGLALSWFVAGWVATRARPDHPEALLLLAVGALHLGAFGMSAAVALSAASGWPAWLGEAVAGLVFDAGFGALALVLALFPHGRGRRRAQRMFTGIVAAAVVAVAVVPVLTSASLTPVVTVGREAVPAPAGLPLVEWDVDLFLVLPVLVLTGVVLLVVLGRQVDQRHRAVYTWPAGAGGLIVLLLLGTPLAVPVLGGPAWAVIFVLGAATVPWALLAGLTRYRLLAVDVQVSRALARGALAVLVLACFGLVAAVSDERASPVVAAGVAVVAALTGEQLRRRLEVVVDRLVTGGRVRRTAREQELRHAGEPIDPAELAERAVSTLARVLEVSWVRLVRDGDVVARAGRDDQLPELTVPVVTGERVLGSLDCGPRHGGWRSEQVEAVREVAHRVGLLWDNARLSSALADRVADLEASRRRLVAAEEHARRRLERDLHDGVQQQLVALLVRLELLRALLPADSRAGEVTAAAHDLAGRSLAELRELVRGIRPPVLADHGLVTALESRAAQMPIPVRVDADPRVDGVRYPAEVESAAYFVALEALTNVLKHAGGAGARVVVAPTVEGLTIAVGDEGCGFDGAGGGTGLGGMRDRVEALGGTLSVTSAVGVGTTVSAHLPAGVIARA